MKTSFALSWEEPIAKLEHPHFHLSGIQHIALEGHIDNHVVAFFLWSATSPLQVMIDSMDLNLMRNQSSLLHSTKNNIIELNLVLSTSKTMREWLWHNQKFDIHQVAFIQRFKPQFFSANLKVLTLMAHNAAEIFTVVYILHKSTMPALLTIWLHLVDVSADFHNFICGIWGCPDHALSKMSFQQKFLV
jgi:hypothetical protein